MDTDDAPPREGVVFPDTERSMNPSVRDTWVKALLSKQYKEGKYRLRTVNDEYDAMGVLCDLAVRAGVCSWDKTRFDDHYMIFGSSNCLPNIVREWAEIQGCHPSQDIVLEWGSQLHPIWRLSDHYGVSFEVLARLIHTQY